MTLLVRTLTIAALAAVLVQPAGAAPSAPSARVTYGKPTVSWAIPPGSTADTIQFVRSLPAEPNAFWRNADEQSPLRPRQMSWTAGDRLAPGTWYVHVSAVAPGPPDAEDVIEWSPVTRFMVAPTPGIVPGKGVDYATLDMRTGDVRAALGPPPSLDGARGSRLRVLRRCAARPLRRRPRYSLRGAVRPVQGRGHEHPRRLEGSRTAGGGQGSALPELENAVALRVQTNAPSILLPRLARQGRRNDVFRDQVRAHLEREARPGRLREVRPVLRPPPLAESRGL
jgi:hypothetical protein